MNNKVFIPNRYKFLIKYLQEGELSVRQAKTFLSDRNEIETYILAKGLPKTLVRKLRYMW